MIDRIVIRFGGAVAPELCRYVEKIRADYISNRPESAPGFSAACDQLKLGKMSLDRFAGELAKVFSHLGSGRSISGLWEDRARCHAGAAEFPAKLNARRPLLLVVDYPESWFWAAAARNSIFEGAPAGEPVFLSHAAGSSRGEEQLESIYKQPGCLIIEPDFNRAMRCINQGVQTIHYVDISRTMRELDLRKLTPAGYVNGTKEEL